LAIVIIGGLIGATFFALFVFPLIVELVYSKMLYDKDGRLKQKKTIKRIFVLSLSFKNYGKDTVW
jgi:hypothetical protein